MWISENSAMHSHLAYFQRYWNMWSSRLRKKKERWNAILCDSRKSTESRIDPRACVDSTIIRGAFHRIASRNEKTHSFLNLFQLKSQSFVTLGSISLSAFPAVSALSPFCLLRSRWSLLLLVFAFRQEKKGRREIGIPGFFASNYFTASFLKH